MAKPRNLQIQTPGEPVVGDAQPAEVAQAEAAGGEPAVAAELPNGNPRKELKVDPAVRNASEETTASAARSVSELPDQNDVDPAKIPFGQRVMSKQGWVCSTQEPPQQVRR